MKQQKITVSQKHYDALGVLAKDKEMPAAYVLRNILDDYFSGKYTTNAKAYATPEPAKPKRPSMDLRRAINMFKEFSPGGPVHDPRNPQNVQQERHWGAEFKRLSGEEGFDWSLSEAIQWMDANPRNAEEEKLLKARAKITQNKAMELRETIPEWLASNPVPEEEDY